MHSCTYSFKSCFKLKITIVKCFPPSSSGVQARHYNLPTIHGGKGSFLFMDQRRRILIVRFLNCIQVAFRKKYEKAGQKARRLCHSQLPKYLGLFKGPSVTQLRNLDGLQAEST